MSRSSSTIYRTMKTSILTLVLAFCALTLHAGEKEERAGVEQVMPKLMSAWNDQSFKEMLQLYHEVSRLRYEMKEINDDAKVKSMHHGIMKKFGAMKGFNIGSYSDRKNEFQLSIVYAEKGKVTGTISLTEKDGTWLIRDWDIDG